MAEQEHKKRWDVRVVVDTNVLISKIISQKGTAGRAVDVATAKCTLLSCTETIAELSVKLSEERFFRYASDDERAGFILSIEQQSEMVVVHTEVRVSPDPKDDIFLALAFDGRADLIVSGDKKHLLCLGSHEGIPIISPADFLIRMGE